LVRRVKVITARVEDRYIRDLREIEKAEKTDRAEVVRRLLAEGIREWKLHRALGMLRKHAITLRRAAKIAGLSYREMLDAASQAGIDSGYGLKNLEKDLKRL
jgi:predicted HTH domain antitoxin